MQYQSVACQLLKEKIEQGQNVLFEVSSSSMSPLLEKGYHVLIEKAGLNNLEIGDIIVFQNNEYICAHRIIRKSDNFIITKGDASPYFDGKIYPRDVLGKVTKIINNKGAAINLEGHLCKILNYIIGILFFIENLIIEILHVFRKTFLKNKFGIMSHRIKNYFLYIYLKFYQKTIAILLKYLIK